MTISVDRTPIPPNLQNVPYKEAIKIYRDSATALTQIPEG